MLGLSIAAAQSGSSEARTEEELEALRARIEEVQEKLDADRSERSEAEQRIESLDREIAGLAVAVRDKEREQARIRDEIAGLEAQKAELEERLAAQKAHVARLAYTAYVMGRQSQLKLFLNQQDPAVINRMLGYHDYIVAARARTIQQINGWAAEVQALAEEQSAKQVALQTLVEEFRAEQARLQVRREEREVALAAVKAQISSSEDELSSLKDNEQRLQRILEELKVQLAESSRQVRQGAFRGMRGKLRLPVSAPIAVGFGEPRSTGVRWDGIMFRPENGDEVKAIFEGRVVYADWLRGFGLLLIIDHGDGFMSLYSHNESLFKQLGDWVDTEEVIATVGTSGGLDRPGLYFEIRHDGEPQNPLSWCQRA